MRQSNNKRSPAGQKGAIVDALLPEQPAGGVVPTYFIAGWIPWALAAASYFISILIFEPIAFAPAAFITFVPWLIGLCTAHKARWAYLSTFGFGLAFWLTQSNWLSLLSPAVYIAAGVVLGGYMLPAAWCIRHLHLRRRLPLTLVFPLVWTAYDFLHSRGPLGTPWCLLAHSQAQSTVLIQISDCLGAFGVTTLVALVNGWCADLALGTIALRQQRHVWYRRLASAAHTGETPVPQGRRWSRRLWISTAATLLVFAATVVYGKLRLAQQCSTYEPRVAVIQGDFILKLDLDRSQRIISDPLPLDDDLDFQLRTKKLVSDADKRLVYERLLSEAAKQKPDLIVLPETPWMMVLNREYRESPLSFELPEYRLQNREFARLARACGAAIVVGALSREPRAPGLYPAMDEYNSAFVYRPGESEPERYDKVHPVLVGEYLPCRESRRFFWFYRLLNDGPWNPWGRGGQEYATTPGSAFRTFSFSAASCGGKTFRFGAAICYEDSMPHEYRRLVADDEGNKRVDFMVTLSNAGWFQHGAQQALHLTAATFRAVENRVWMARATNTGISGFIDSDGRWRHLVSPSDNQPECGGIGYRVAQIGIDSRQTFYTRHGDLWGGICLAFAATALADALAAGVRRRLLRVRGTSAIR